MAAIWHRAGCCCIAECEHCDEGTTPPRKITLVVAGITACGCRNPAGTYHIAVTLPATVDVINTVAGPCVWEKLSAGTLTRTIYEDPNCAGGVTQQDVGAVNWQLAKQDGLWSMLVWTGFGEDEPYELFYDAQAETDCSNGVTFTNDLLVANCPDIVGPGGRIPAAYGGTITKAVT